MLAWLEVDNSSIYNRSILKSDVFDLGLLSMSTCMRLAFSICNLRRNVMNMFKLFGKIFKMVHSVTLKSIMRAQYPTLELVSLLFDMRELLKKLLSFFFPFLLEYDYGSVMVHIFIFFII